MLTAIYRPQAGAKAANRESAPQISEEEKANAASVARIQALEAEFLAMPIFDDLLDPAKFETVGNMLATKEALNSTVRAAVQERKQQRPPYRKPKETATPQTRTPRLDYSKLQQEDLKQRLAALRMQ